MRVTVPSKGTGKLREGIVWVGKDNEFSQGPKISKGLTCVPSNVFYRLGREHRGKKTESATVSLEAILINFFIKNSLSVLCQEWPCVKRVFYYFNGQR